VKKESEKYDTLIVVKYTGKKKRALQREAKKRGVKYSSHLRDLLDQPIATRV